MATATAMVRRCPEAPFPRRPNSTSFHDSEKTGNPPVFFTIRPRSLLLSDRKRTAQLTGFETGRLVFGVELADRSFHVRRDVAAMALKAELSGWNGLHETQHRAIVRLDGFGVGKLFWILSSGDIGDEFFQHLALEIVRRVVWIAQLQRRPP